MTGATGNMPRINFDLDGIGFDILRPEHVRFGDEWSPVANLVGTGCGMARAENELTRDVERRTAAGEWPPADPAEAQRVQAEQQALVDGTIQETKLALNALALPTFIKSRCHPETAFPGQTFARPLIIRAFDQGSGKLVGYNYSAYNTSSHDPDQSLLRDFKMHAPRWTPRVGGKRYVWQRETVVDPNYEGRGIGTTMLGLSLAERKPHDPVTACIFPDELARNRNHWYRIMDTMAYFGFRITDIAAKPLLGRGREARQFRMLGNTGEVEQNIRSLPGASKALGKAASHPYRIRLH